MSEAEAKRIRALEKEILDEIADVDPGEITRSWKESESCKRKNWEDDHGHKRKFSATGRRRTEV